LAGLAYSFPNGSLPAALPPIPGSFDPIMVLGVTLLINHVKVFPTFAGLTGAGLYRINMTLSAGLGTGDVPLAATVQGNQTPANVVISLQ
jgi:uncharacterized protein (TIGR03437 family)